MDDRSTTNKFVLDLLDSLKGDDQPLEAPTMVLFKNSPSADKSVTYADLVLCDFAGYTDKTNIAFSSAHKGSDGKYRLTAPSQFYEVTADGETVQQAKGYAIVNAGKTTVHFVVVFDEPIDADEKDVGFSVQPELVYGD